MLSRKYIIRHVEAHDRALQVRRMERAEAGGDPEEVREIADSYAQWEKEQGEVRERLVCAVCGSIWLSPTANGLARPHRRDDETEKPTWDKVRSLRKGDPGSSDRAGPTARCAGGRVDRRLGLSPAGSRSRIRLRGGGGAAQQVLTEEWLARA